MGRRRKGRKETSEKTQVSIAEEEGDDEGGGEGGSGKFFAVYLLTSLSPRFKGHTYIGFTVNPRRRIRQHNGEIGSGAWRTKKRRPWEMVFCIFGFPTNVAALQFEWAWQHPVESVAVRKAAATFKSLSGLANKIKLAYTMLTLPSWQSLNLTVNYFSTKYMKLAAGCPSLPEQMRIRFGSMDELPCYAGGTSCMGENDEWDLADDYCEQSGGSQESTEDGSTDFQKPNDLTAGQDSFQGIEYCGQDNCAKENVHEQEGSTESTVFRLPKNLQIREEQVHKQSFQLNDSPVRKPSLSVLCCNKITRNAEDSGMFSLLDEFSVECHELSEDQSPEEATANKDDGPLSISSEVEVIDVFTPSPCYKGTNNKKRGLSIGCPEIIDLTNSPMFV